jgi:hypothetical protein
MVNSPYAGNSQLVDVAGMAPGQTVKCPYSGKLFRVPPTQQASSSKSESKLDSPKLSSPEPKSSPKPAAEKKDSAPEKKESAPEKPAQSSSEPKA